MDDATSGYSSGYTWGNNYWIGSMALCRSIYKHNENHHYRKESSNVGLTFINGNTAHAHVKHENPPFLPRFSVLRVILSEIDIAPNVSISSFDSSFGLNILNDYLASNCPCGSMSTDIMRKGRYFYNG